MVRSCLKACTFHPNHKFSVSVVLPFLLFSLVPTIISVPNIRPSDGQISSPEGVQLLQPGPSGSINEATHLNPRRFYKRDTNSLTTTIGISDVPPSIEALIYNWQLIAPDPNAITSMVQALSQIQISLANIDTDTIARNRQLSLRYGNLRVQFKTIQPPRRSLPRNLVVMPTGKQIMEEMLQEVLDWVKRGFVGFCVVSDTAGQLGVIIMILGLFGTGRLNVINNLIVGP